MIESITLLNFRNYKFRQFEFNGKINLIVGENGVGKTNLLEAISMISIPNGIRGASLQELNQNYQTPFSIGFETKIGRIGISNNAGLKKFSLEQENIRFSKLSEAFPVIHLMPEDEFIFSSSVSERRTFFDKIFGKINPSLPENLKNYKDLCTERIKLLEENASNSWILAIEKQIAVASVLIATHRVLIAEKISSIMSENTSGLQGKILISGHLESKINSGTFVATAEEKKMCESLLEARKLDKITGKTLTGFERTNADVFFQEKSIFATKSSSGEQKKMIFATLLACTKLLLREGKKPIILIDEVIAKLDLRGRNLIISELQNLDCQSFLTGTETLESNSELNIITL